MVDGRMRRRQFWCRKVRSRSFEVDRGSWIVGEVQVKSMSKSNGRKGQRRGIDGRMCKGLLIGSIKGGRQFQCRRSKVEVGSWKLEDVVERSRLKSGRALCRNQGPPRPSRLRRHKVTASKEAENCAVTAHRDVGSMPSWMAFSSRREASFWYHTIFHHSSSVPLCLAIDHASHSGC